MSWVRVLVCCWVMILAGTSLAQRQQGTLKVGVTAPDFTLTDAEGKKTVRLSDLKGKPVVLIFGSCT